MRRTGRLFDAIVDRDNFQRAFARAIRGKRDRLEAREFAADLEANLQRLMREARAETLELGRSIQFMIHDPKPRLITAPCFRERVLHHAIMNVCEPEFERSLIWDTYACRVGKGRDAAILRAREYAGRFPCFLKFDVRKYFDSISHEVLLERLRRRFKDVRLHRLFERILAGYATTAGRGLPIGSLTSQHFANFYLDGLDRFAKETLGAAGYVRYMDDVMIWGGSTARLREWLVAIERFLADRLRLTLKPSPYLNRVTHGVDFLGLRVFPSHVALSRRARSRFRRKSALLDRWFDQGVIGEEGYQQRATSLTAFTKSCEAKSWRFRRHVLDCEHVGGQGPRTG